MKTTIFLDSPDAAALRILASRLGFTTSRGPGAGSTGNVRALLGGLALAYRLKPTEIETLFSAALGLAPVPAGRGDGPPPRRRPDD